jgi:uncharacterized protein
MDYSQLHHAVDQLSLAQAEAFLVAVASMLGKRPEPALSAAQVGPDAKILHRLSFTAAGNGPSDLAERAEDYLRASAFGLPDAWLRSSATLVPSSRYWTSGTSCTGFASPSSISSRATWSLASLIITEVCYLAQTQVGPEAEARFLDSVVANEVKVEDSIAAGWARITQLVRQYAGFPLGVANAAVIAVAERLGITRLASIDNRHMRTVKPAHCDAFELLPGCGVCGTEPSRNLGNDRDGDGSVEAGPR